MRIVSLRFKNINSLAGEWKIDFTDPAYLSTGIFAITGPTGAGKSTILDAIALALYGRTPRLGKIAKNAGELMSRQTGECFSEVEFVSDKGRYRCTWSVKRAHKKPDGELQSPKHEIVDALTGVPLETKQAAVLGKVVEVTGLDYQQFTRSILLAQGDFATFLDAKADDRSLILDKITGTEIYGQISVAVHERFTREKAKLETLAGKVGALETISPEQAETLRAEKQQYEKEISEIAAHCKNLEAAAAWQDTITTLETEIVSLRERGRVLAGQKSAAEKDLGRLHLARRARDLEGIYSGLFELRKQQVLETQEKTVCEEQLAEFSAAYARALDTFRLGQERYETAAKEKQREEELCRSVRDLDTQIREIRTRHDEYTGEKQRLEEETGKYRESIQSAERLLEGIRPDLAKAITYLTEHPRDEKLIASLSGIESAARQIHATEKTAEQKREALLGVEHGLADAEQVVIRRKNDLDKAAGRVQAAIVLSDRIKKELAELTGGRDGPALRLPAEEYAERERRLKTLLDLLVRIEEENTVLEKLSGDLDTVRAGRKANEERHVALRKEAEMAAELLRISEENRVYLARIKSLEDARSTLPDGIPCPLCGSTNHPWCTGAVPVPGDAERKHKACKKENEELQTKVRKSEADLAGIDAGIRAGETALREREAQAKKVRAELEAGCRAMGIPTGSAPKLSVAAALKECTARLEESRKILSQAEEKERELKKVEQTLAKEKDAHAEFQRDYDKTLAYRDTQISVRDRLKDEIATYEEEARKEKDAFLFSVQEYGVFVFSRPTMTEEILFGLTKCRDDYRANLARKQELETAQQRYTADAEKNRSLLFAAEKNLAPVTGTLAGILETLKKHTTKRRELYGEKDPAAEEERMKKLVKTAEQEFSAAAETKNQAYARKNSCEDQIKTLAFRMETRHRELLEKEQEFFAGLARAEFTGEDQFISARISPDILAGLEALEKDLVREGTELATGLRERTAKLEAEQKRALTKSNREDLATAIENDKTRATTLQIEIGGIRTKLEQYHEQEAQRKNLLEEIARQKKEFSRWENLHDLIGSADGKKFRVFAQGLTFEKLVVQANKHLRKMSDRYVLLRDKTSPLDLDILDNYQAGEIRTTKNLSGGERFLVSLALALGLSGMASHNVRIDSLFLDEGFGTLDEDTLETALETLASLQREGKIIGIISHVPALKERIPVQIQVEPTGGGRSRIFGPGCVGPDPVKNTRSF
ncbi:MAG: AAA family ATPase [Methanoregula sp.]|jgi:exonuclease SbcC